MICYICGKLVTKSPAKVIIEQNGIGYSANVSINTSESLGLEGSEVKIFTHLQIKEDSIELYGFYDEKEKEAFLMLLAVPGIGPKVAVRILSGLSTEELYNAIISEDTSFFTTVPGIGKKTGERLIVELKQRIEKIPFTPSGSGKSSEKEIFSGAVEALTVLGYRRKEAASIVKKVVQQGKPEMTIEDVLKEALKKSR